MADFIQNGAAAGTLPSSESTVSAAGADGIGTHVSGGNGLTTVEASAINGLVKTPFDQQVVKMAWSTTPINAMTRDMGSRPLKAMEYGYYSVDLRQCNAKVGTTAVDIPANYSATQPVKVDITLVAGHADRFDATDVIIFPGVAGYRAADTVNPGYDTTKGVDLAARVCEIKSADNKISVQFLNAPVSTSAKTGYIEAGADIYILGHAAAEIEASTTPYAALPNKRTQYMQKFMVQSLISSVMMESEKEVSWGKSDVNEILMQQFLEDIEKTYIWGVKSYTYDSSTKLWTRTTSGIVEQLIEGGANVIELGTISDGNLVLKKEDVFNMINKCFVGNSGSTQRYFYTGIDLATKFFSIDNINDWVNANETVRKFEYDFSKIKLFNYTLLNIAHPLFDKFGWRSNGLILDRQYVERRVFRSMDETALELKKTGAYDGESSVWSEISSVVVKYPKCHAIVKLAK